MVDDAYEHDEYRLILVLVVLSNLLVEVQDLVNVPVDEAEREVHHVHEDFDFVRIHFRIRR